MRLMKSFITVALAAWFAFVPPAFAKDKVNLSAELNTQTEYNIRGFNYGEKPVVQLTGIANRGPFSLIGFINHDLSSEEINEADLSADYTGQVGDKWTLSLGYTYLTFPNTGLQDSQEAYSSLTFNSGFRPTFMVAYDFDQGNNEGDGIYAQLSASYDFGLTANVAVGWNQGQYRDKNGFSHLELTLERQFQVMDGLAVTPWIAAQKSLDSDYFDDRIFGGIKFSF